MIKVTIELIPGGIGKPKHLGTINISNKMTGTKTKGDYKVVAFDKAGRRWREGEVKGFPRKQLLGHDLLYRALKSIIGYRNNE